MQSDSIPASILIVDDDEAVTQTFARMLELEGYAVRTARNAETGLREAQEYLPDAIILDLRMPLMDGLGFLRRLRANAGQASIPVWVDLVAIAGVVAIVIIMAAAMAAIMAADISIAGAIIIATAATVAP